jgi:hypothetical protein
MRTNTRLLLVVAALAATLITTAALAASPVKINNCIKAVTRPSRMTLACGDGNTALTGLKWSSFGGSTAKGKGTLATDTCEPNCAEGKTVRYAVTVKATNPRTCKKGLRVYNKLTLQFTGAKPTYANSIKNWTPGCPT